MASPSFLRLLAAGLFFLLSTTANPIEPRGEFRSESSSVTDHRLTGLSISRGCGHVLESTAL